MDISGRGIMLQKLENDGLVGKVMHFELGLASTSECKVLNLCLGLAQRCNNIMRELDPNGYTSRHFLWAWLVGIHEAHFCNLTLLRQHETDKIMLYLTRLPSWATKS